MNPITITLTKIRTKRRLINLGVILAFVLILIGGYFLVFRGVPGLRVAQVLPEKKMEKEELPEVVITSPEKNEAPTQPKVYEEVAEPGEGITHLARKALKEYLKEKGGPNLTPEHKIFIEDYLQKKTGDYWLKVGQKVTFSEELIKEAIEKAQTLTQEQLQNLTQYAKLVPELNY
jgi:predicted transcriptional regulator